MEKGDYASAILAKVSPKEAFEKICRVSEWWGVRFEGESRKLNDVFTVRFGNGDMYKAKLSEMIPEKKIVWDMIDSHQTWVANATEWTGTRVVWEISLRKDGTRIDMRHIGLNPSLECNDKCNQGWDYLIKTSLLQFLTENKGLPV